MNKQQLASKIWESANKMRSKIEANEYKDYILGFIFYKFLSDQEVKYLQDNDWTDEYLPEVTEEDEETVENIRKNLGYFISYNNLFSTWLEKGSDFSADDVANALSAFSRLINPAHKDVYTGIFKTLEEGMSKLGTDSKSRTKAIHDLIYLIKDIPMNGKQDYDVLGFIYEYLISNFAANAGKKAGEFYTPHEVSILMSEIVAHHLRDRQEIKIYDPTSGSGSLLINIGKIASRYMGVDNHIKYYAQELKENTYNLTRMNLVMRGILPDNIVTRNGDTLQDDWPYFDETDPVGTYDTLYVDAVVSNPPYSQHWDRDEHEADPRYNRFGLAPKTKADYAFLLHDLYHLKPDGIMTIVLPHGVLFRGGEEGRIRQNLIEQNNIDAVIGLPASVFFGTGIPVIIMVLKQNRSNTDVLFIDASKGFKKIGKNNILRSRDIKKIVDTVTGRKDVEKFSRVVSREEIRKNDYNLNISRYVDSSEDAETWDIYGSMFSGIPAKELDEFKGYWEMFPGLKEQLFSTEDDHYFHPTRLKMREVIQTHPSVSQFKEKFEYSFNDFKNKLVSDLIDKIMTLNILESESRMSDYIFSKIQEFPLIDPYESYELLDDEWQKITVDLEILQTEGLEAARQVDPNLVIKTKNNKKVEVQDGWKGHVLPFELVQKQLFSHDLDQLEALTSELSETTSQIEMYFNGLTEEDKLQDFVKDSQDKFDKSGISRILKSKNADEDTLELLNNVNQLFKKETDVKKEIKKLSTTLHQKTKAKIEQLTEKELNSLLVSKWIDPLVNNMDSLPDKTVDNLINLIEKKCKKYDTAFIEIDEELKTTTHELLSLLDELQGSDYDMQGIAELKRILED